ncbi:mandelate racemase/muconate lactonizing enzyme family protein [Sphingomonas sp. RB1R13]|uniref:mandelate racemase/muconate lactonizing enzyme family protein n=1 Tax=Sphingomonas sp. RB1R13 TaxID=3096159 RepID=UPI002FC6DB8F
MNPVVAIETFIVTSPRDVPYLGPLGPGEAINAKGYVVRKGNGTLYPTTDRSVAVRITARDGTVGWGETYGICAPRAVCEIIDDLFAPVVVGTEPGDVESTWDTLYGLMRVRGHSSGFTVDGIAAIDIALWDLRARQLGLPLWAVIGERVHDRIPSYVSGLPAGSLQQRVALAVQWKEKGHRAIKFAAVISHDGIAEEFAALRSALGPDVDLMADLHWKFDPPTAVALSSRLAPFTPRFIEAPVSPEDVGGLAYVIAHSEVPIAAGEEWSTEYEAALRLNGGGLAFIQPEMAHTGVTQFLRILRLAERAGIAVAPHATIGTGIFLAASLHASATSSGLWRHEWQPSVFDGNLKHLQTSMAADSEGYLLPEGMGLGATPAEAFWRRAEPITSFPVP